MDRLAVIRIPTQGLVAENATQRIHVVSLWRVLQVALVDFPNLKLRRKLRNTTNLVRRLQYASHVLSPFHANQPGK